jgi:hypothetical protein
MDDVAEAECVTASLDVEVRPDEVVQVGVDVDH